MKLITKILIKLMPKEVQKPVGRWSIEKCNTKINHKVDLSNEDHCGPCGQYLLTKMEPKKQSIKIDLENKNIKINLEK